MVRFVYASLADRVQVLTPSTGSFRARASPATRPYTYGFPMLSIVSPAMLILLLRQLAGQLQDAGLFKTVTSDGHLKDKKELYQYPDTHPHKFEPASPDEAEEHGACIGCGELVWHDDKSGHVRCTVCHETYALRHLLSKKKSQFILVATKRVVLNLLFLFRFIVTTPSA